MITKRKPHSHNYYLYVISLLVLLSSSYVAYASLRPLPPIKPQSITLPKLETGVSSVTWPDVGSAAVGTLDWGVLASHNDAPHPTASTIKLLTALTILQAKPFAIDSQGTSLTLNAADVAFYEAEQARGGSIVPVIAGETITERQALEALLLPSANNIAITLATWAYGSMPAYIASANQLAQSLGMQTTTIKDASGFSPLTTSTSRDLVELGIAALKNPVIASIMSEKSASLPVVGVVHNVNTLLGTNDIIGGKTGNTPEAGGVFIGVSHSIKDGREVMFVSAVMNAPSLGSALDATPSLVSSAERNIVDTPLFTAGDPVAAYTVPWSSSTFHAVVSQTATPLRWLDEPVHNVIHSAPVSAGQREAGDISTAIHQIHYTTNLELDHPIPSPSLFWRLTHIF